MSNIMFNKNLFIELLLVVFNFTQAITTLIVQWQGIGICTKSIPFHLRKYIAIFNFVRLERCIIDSIKQSTTFKLLSMLLIPTTDAFIKYQNFTSIPKSNIFQLHLQSRTMHKIKQQTNQLQNITFPYTVSTFDP